MKHSQRLLWAEAAYDKLRALLIPEAPAHVTLTIGFPSRKGSKQTPTVGECCFDCIRSHGEGFGGENLVTLHLKQFDDPVSVLGTLVHEMIHHALDPDVKHGKQFQEMAKRLGLVKPWTATTPDDALAKTLRGIVVDLEHELGYSPVGYYVPPPPRPVKPKQSVRLKCGCDSPRVFTVSAKILEKGSILCGLCRGPFRTIRENEGLD